MIGIQGDIEMHSGDTRELQFTIKDESDVVVDLTGATPVKWELSMQDPDSSLPKPLGSAKVQKGLGTGITLTDAPNGVLTVVVAPADTAALTGDYYHELEITLAGNVSTVAFGAVTIRKDLIA